MKNAQNVACESSDARKVPLSRGILSPMVARFGDSQQPCTARNDSWFFTGTFRRAGTDTRPDPIYRGRGKSQNRIISGGQLADASCQHPSTIRSRTRPAFSVCRHVKTGLAKYLVPFPTRFTHKRCAKNTLPWPIPHVTRSTKRSPRSD